MADTVQLNLLDATIAEVVLDRPRKKNAMTMGMFHAVGATFNRLTRALTALPDGDPDEKYANVRVVVMRGAGTAFSSGIDLSAAAEMGMQNSRDDTARTALRTYHFVRGLQACFTAIVDCPVPVIAAVHGVCYGAGVDVIAACDIRLASSNATFSVKEVDIGIAADVGTLQRLPRIVGNMSVVREWAYTARPFTADEALRQGLLSYAGGTPEECMERAVKLAKEIASKSPVAIAATKLSLNTNDDVPVRRGLKHIATLNAAALQTDDTQLAAAAGKKKELAVFAKL